MFRCSISNVLMLCVVIAIAAAWFVDHKQLVRRIERENHLISYYGEKLSLWSPANYLRRDTQALEAQLSDRIDSFSGAFVASSQGIGDEQLRQPTLETLDAVTDLLEDADDATRVAAAELVALYLQGVSGDENVDTHSLVTRAHFQTGGMAKAVRLLGDPNVNVRSAAALVLGNTLYDQHTIQVMKDAFDQETDQAVRLHLSWAYWALANNFFGLNQHRDAAEERDAVVD